MELKCIENFWINFGDLKGKLLPIIGKSKQNNNVIYAFGHQHVGWTLGAVTGKIIDSLSKDQVPNIDITAYSPSRF